MKKLFLFVFVISTFHIDLHSQNEKAYNVGDESLIFINQDPGLDSRVSKGLIDTYFAIYPVLKKNFNPSLEKKIEVKIDTSYKGVAYAHDGKIVISANWLKENPYDFDVITHEVMHIVQSYPPGSAPGWLVEGVADYVRYKYGLHNEKAGWELPEFSIDHSFTDSYRITARFLVWLSHRFGETSIKILDQKMRENLYSENLWKEITDSSLEDLWSSYIKEPNIL